MNSSPRKTDGLGGRDMLEAKAMSVHLKDHPAKDWVAAFQNGSLRNQTSSSVRRAYFGTRTALTALNGTSVGGSDGNEERDDSGEAHIGLRDVLWKGGISERLGREDTGGK
ncbi:hypothetical protein C8J57DRAFT_1223506 [Mycena rebaudengoi]|nr:hypothetical protein C8J57DRAFT_1223506 [Mycena rebaudengoi]